MNRIDVSGDGVHVKRLPGCAIIKSQRNVYNLYGIELEIQKFQKYWWNFIVTVTEDGINLPYKSFLQVLPLL